MDIATVNALTYEDFVNVLGNVVEKCPLIAAAVWSGRPFLTLTALEAAIREFIDALPESGEKVHLVIRLETCKGTDETSLRHYIRSCPQVRRGSSGATLTSRAGTSRAAP